MVLESIIFFLVMATVIIVGALLSIRVKADDEENVRAEKKAVASERIEDAIAKSETMITYDHHDKGKREMSA